MLVSSIPPSATYMYSFGKAELIIFAITCEVCGANSLGFRIAVLPAAIAGTSGDKVSW